MSKAKKYNKKHHDPRRLANKMFNHMNGFHDALLRHDSPSAGPEKLSELLALCKEAGFTPDEKIAERKMEIGRAHV